MNRKAERFEKMFGDEDAPLKCVVASPFKTGTSSVGIALMNLGVGSRDMMYRPGLMKEIQPVSRKWNIALDEADDPLDLLSRNEVELREDFKPLSEAIEQFDIFSDAPFGHTHVHPVIRKVLAPGARFIWVNRRRKSWLESVRNWEITHPDTYPNWEIWERDPEKRISKLKSNWQRHFRRFRMARRLFPRDCLTLRLEKLTSYAELCEFFGTEDPGVPFPITNVSRGDDPDV